MPEFKKVAQMVGVFGRPSRIELVGVQGRGESELKFAEEIGIRREDVVTTDITKLKLRAVPTFMIVDRSLKILFVTERKPDSDELVQMERIIDRGRDK
jgi:hypothetical protein